MGCCQPSGRKLRWTNNADGQVKKAENLSSSFVSPLPTICSLCKISVWAEAIAEKMCITNGTNGTYQPGDNTPTVVKRCGPRVKNQMESTLPASS